MWKVTLRVLLLFAVACELRAQDTTSAAKDGPVDDLFGLADKVIDILSRDSWLFIPAVTYSPETSFGLGMRAMKIFRPINNQDSLTRPSSLPLTFLYTFNQQAIFTSELDFWENSNTGYLNARLELADYPFRFYGIGNSPQTDEVYATRYIYFHINYEKRIGSGLYVGPRYEFRSDAIYETTELGLLSSGTITGSDGQRISGLGLQINYDTRNNIFQPSSGAFHQISLMTFQQFLGSIFTFSQYQFDFRKYLQIKPKHMLVGQAWLSLTTGNPPFQQVSLTGGSNLMRGYFEGKYRDMHAMVYQAEYRLPVYKSFGLVLFGSAGQVSPTLGGFAADRFRYGGGLGFRYRLNEEGLNIRLDIGIGDQRAFYFGLNEVI